MLPATASVIAAKTALVYEHPLWRASLPSELGPWYRFVAGKLPFPWGPIYRSAIRSPQVMRRLLKANTFAYAGDWEHIVMRKSLMAMELRNLCDSKTGVIQIGAGFDAYSLALPESTVILECDFPDVIATKERLWQLFGSPTPIRFIPSTEAVDTGRRFYEHVQASGLQAWVVQCEGVLEYLDDAAVATLLGPLQAFPGPVTLLTTQFDFARLGPLRERMSLDALDLLGEPLAENRSSEHWRALFERGGWTLTDMPSDADRWKDLSAAYPALRIACYRNRV